MDVVVIESQIPNAIFDESTTSAQNVRFVGFHDFAHQSLGHFILGFLQLSLDGLPEKKWIFAFFKHCEFRNNYLKSGMPEDPVRPSVGCSYTSESMRIKVPDLVLTNLSGFLKLEDLGLSSGLESMLFFRFKSALNSLSFICSDMFILFDFCWRVMKRLTLI